MLEAVNLSVADFHYQEYPACHFNPVRSVATDWRERGAHCLTHVRDTVEREGIRLLMLTGPAAVILLGEEEAQRLSKAAGRVDVDTGSKRLPALVMRSPAALIALERKRLRLKEQGDQDEFARVTAQEKEIKSSMLQALRAALGELNV